MIYFKKTDDIENIKDMHAERDTTLTAWFQLNSSDVSATRHLYTDIPEFYVYDRNRGWTKRKRGGDNVIGRMYTVSIAEGERYYLRLLLLHTPGATSFDDLKTVNGVLCDTFKEAVRRFGLLDDDSVWEATLGEGVSQHMPKALRELFAS